MGAQKGKFLPLLHTKMHYLGVREKKTLTHFFLHVRSLGTQ